MSIPVAGILTGGGKHVVKVAVEVKPLAGELHRAAGNREAMKTAAEAKFLRQGGLDFYGGFCLDKRLC